MDFAMTEKEKKNGNEIIKRQLAFFKAMQSRKTKRKRKECERDEKQISMEEFAK